MKNYYRRSSPGGSGTSTAIDTATLWMPKGYLTTWDAALAQAKAGSALAEVVVKGDSTTFGQTSTGSAGYNANNYAWTSKLRRLAIASGYPDGGPGTVGWDDSASMNPTDAVDGSTAAAFSRADTGCGTTSGSNVVTDPSILATDIGRKVVPGIGGFGANGFVGSVTPGVSFTMVTAAGGATALNATITAGAGTMTLSSDGWSANGFYGPSNLKDIQPLNTTQTGFTTVLQGKTTTCRIGYMTFTGGAGGSFTYSMDGAATQTISCNGATRTANYVTISGLTAATLHQLTLSVTVAGSIEVWVEWVNAAGVVFHKHGVPGTKLADQLPSQSATHALGLAVGSAYANNGVTAAPGGGPRNVQLGLLMLGINEVSASSSQTDAVTNRAQLIEQGLWAFAEYCKNAGVPGVVLVQWMWAQTGAGSYAGTIRRAIWSSARAFGLAVADVGAAVTDPPRSSLYGLSYAANPHMNSTGYDALATWVWQNILDPATAAR